MSTRILAAGCTTSSSLSSVAPSLEMVTPCPAAEEFTCALEPAAAWPPAAPTRSVCMSLSMPRGPSVVRTASTRAMQALMLLISCGLPWEVSVPSLSRMICGCCTGKAHSQSTALQESSHILTATPSSWPLALGPLSIEAFLSC